MHATTHEQRYSVVQRIRYRFDNALTRGVGLILIWLALITLATIFLVAAIAWLWGAGPGDQRVPFLESVWLSLTRVLDPGTFGADNGAHFRSLMLVITLAGILLLAIVIGLVSNAIDRRLELLRQGRSLVVETDHTLILGYSNKVPSVVRELVEANLSRRKSAIVVLSAESPGDVHDAVGRHGIDLLNTRLVVRRGNPTSLDDLERMNAHHARSIIVLAPEDETADATVIKVALALKRFGVPFETTPTIVEITDPNLETALREIGGEGLLTVNAVSAVARITARVLRASGVGAVFQDLLDFAGDELYTADAPLPYVGRPFRDLLLASSTCTVIGLLRGGEVLPAPDFNAPVLAGDRIIAISKDDSALVLDRQPADSTSVTERFSLDRNRERTLVVGWSRLGEAICRDNEHHVASGSELVIVVDPALHDADAVGEKLDLERQTITAVAGSAVDRRLLEEVLSDGTYDHILVLAERDRMSVVDADARVLLGLLHIRQWLDRLPEGVRRPNLVGELLDVNDQILGEVARPDDFIVSERLVSLALTQLSENPSIYPVLRRLMDADGVQLCLVGREQLPAFDFTTFDDIVAACREVHLVAIGCQLAVEASDGTHGGTILLNPDRREPIALGDRDRVIALATTP